MSRADGRGSGVVLAGTHTGPTPAAASQAQPRPWGLLPCSRLSSALQWAQGTLCRLGGLTGQLPPLNPEAGGTPRDSAQRLVQSPSGQRQPLLPWGGAELWCGPPEGWEGCLCLISLSPSAWGHRNVRSDPRLQSPRSPESHTRPCRPALCPGDPWPLGRQLSQARPALGLCFLPPSFHKIFLLIDLAGLRENHR